MTFVAATRTPRAAYALVGLVVFLFLVQTGAIVATAVADAGGGTPSSSVTHDTASDVVAATAA